MMLLAATRHQAPCPAMTVGLHDGPVKPPRRLVNLIGEGVAGASLAPLAADFDIRRFSPAEVMRRAACDPAPMMQDAVATLIDWDEHGPMLLALLAEAARCHTVPLVVLCSPNPAEHVAALMVGGDICLSRPINPILLQARLRAYQRLAAPRPVPPGAGGDGLPPVIAPPGSRPFADDVCAVGPLLLDQTGRHFFVYGQGLALTPKEFDLMAFLMRPAGVCRTHDEILDRVWGIDYETGTNVLCVLLHGLRRKLAAHGLDTVIETVRGVGYRLTDPSARKGTFGKEGTVAYRTAEASFPR